MSRLMTLGVLSQSSDPIKLMHIKSTEGLTTELAGGFSWVKAWSDGTINLVEGTLAYCPKLQYDATLGCNVVYFNAGYLGSVSRLYGGNILSIGNESMVVTILIKPDNEGTRNYPMSKWSISTLSAGQWYFRVEATSNQLRGYVVSSITNSAQGTSSPNWKIATLVVDKPAALIRLRENLLEVGTNPYDNTIDLTNTNTFWLGVLGYIPTNSSYNLHGAIAEIIVHRDLTKIEYFEQQIKTKYGL